MITTRELEGEILKKVEILKACDEISIDFIFERNRENGKDGVYIWADNQGYHFVVSERGCELKHKVTDNVFEINFWVVYPLVSRMAFEYEYKNRNNRNSREVAFAKMLEYLSALGVNYRKRGEIEIDEILKVNPY